MNNNKINLLIDSLTDDSPVFQATPYATAWIAKVPCLTDLKTPAFPQSIHWLLANQNTDGSWGPLYPLNPYANSLATLAVLTVLHQWHYGDYQSAIQKGIDALQQLLTLLNQTGMKTFGFELLLTALVEEAQQQGNWLPKSLTQGYEKFIVLGRQQRDMLLTMLEQTQFAVPNVFWLCLPALGYEYFQNNLSILATLEKSLSTNGSILCSVATTAFLLKMHRLNNRDLPQSDRFLQTVIEQNQGGALPYQPMEQYQLAFSLDFLLKGNVAIDNLKQPLGTLHEYWQKRQGLGYSQFSPSLDADDTALGLIALTKAGYGISYKSLLKFFNGEYFSYYLEEPSPSISVNANALRALALFKNHSEIKPIIAKTLNWIETNFQAPFERTLFDSWHCSPFYAASALSFALSEFNHPMNTKLTQWLLSQQNTDGGWGYFGKSSQEETALVVLALTNDKKLATSVAQSLQLAKQFLSQKDNIELASFYMESTMVCPINVVTATILAAKHALVKF
ncbi:MAG: prenyltransferase/squalene oxidase repeat-containing protein [Pseudomonadota bacterium]